jgi:hypothetical protein
MIKIQQAREEDAKIVALLGDLTYKESHGQYIDDRNDLLKYCDEAFSVSKMKQDINDANNLFYIIYVNDLPVGYAKLILNETHESITSRNNCLLDKIYILNEEYGKWLKSI